MCLNINDDSTKLKRKVRKEGKKVIAYKVLIVKGNKLYSPYQETKWPRNKIAISNRGGKNPTKITKQEGQDGEINKGLHFYLDLLYAHDEASYFTGKICIYEVEIEPKDIIAFGTMEVVAHKAKIVKLIRKARKK